MIFNTNATYRKYNKMMGLLLDNPVPKMIRKGIKTVFIRESSKGLLIMTFIITLLLAPVQSKVQLLNLSPSTQILFVLQWLLLLSVITFWLHVGSHSFLSCKCVSVWFSLWLTLTLALTDRYKNTDFSLHFSGVKDTQVLNTGEPRFTKCVVNVFISW